VLSLPSPAAWGVGQEVGVVAKGVGRGLWGGGGGGGGGG